LALIDVLIDYGEAQRAQATCARPERQTRTAARP
jgi:hypothetical protein